MLVREGRNSIPVRTGPKFIVQRPVASNAVLELLTLNLQSLPAQALP
jgi:hypothetical protein